MIRFYFILFILTISLLGAISIDISLGDAFNLKQKLKIGIDSDSESFLVRSKTHGFENPQYYSIRLRDESKKRIKGVQKLHYFELELIHHKLYFEDNLPDYIKKLEFTDGYNFFMGNYSVISQNIGLRMGFGALIVHPDITIQGDEVNLDEPLRIYQKGGGLIPILGKDNGYYLTGWAYQLGVFGTKKINNKISGHVESKIVGALMLDPVEIKYENDHSENQSLLIRTSNLSIHFLVGISFGK